MDLIKDLYLKFKLGNSVWFTINNNKYGLSTFEIPFIVYELHQLMFVTIVKLHQLNGN